MLPILITVLIVAGVLGVVYLIGSQPTKAEKAKTARRARTTAGKAAARAAGPKRSAFRQPPSWVRKLPTGPRHRGGGVPRDRVGAVPGGQGAEDPGDRARVGCVQVDGRRRTCRPTGWSPRRTRPRSSCPSYRRTSRWRSSALRTSRRCSSRRPTTTTRCRAALGELPRGEGTVIGDGLSMGLDAIDAQWAETGTGPAAIVLLSDGHDTGSEVPPQEAADRAAALEIPVYTVVLGPQDGNHGANADAPRADRHHDGGQLLDGGDLRRTVGRLRGSGLAAVVAAADQQLGPAVRVPGDRAGDGCGGAPARADDVETKLTA